MILKSPGNPGLFYDIGKYELSDIIKRSVSYAQAPGKRIQKSKNLPKRRAREVNKARTCPSAGREKSIKQEPAQALGERSQ